MEEIFPSALLDADDSDQASFAGVADPELNEDTTPLPGDDDDLDDDDVLLDDDGPDSTDMDDETLEAEEGEPEPRRRSTSPPTSLPPLIDSPFVTRCPVLRFVDQYDNVELEPLPKQLKTGLKWKMQASTPNLVKKMIRRAGFTVTTKNGWIGTWGRHMKAAAFRQLRADQKLNHFPYSFQLGRKDRLWKNLQHMQARFGRRHFGFIPDTYCLPGDMAKLKRDFEAAKGTSKWILKPNASARGIGIKVVHQWSQIPKRKPYLVQRYLSKPLLINQRKFDLRIYAYVSSFDPLRVYISEEGLVRFATHTYSNKKSKLKNRFMHLTNYSVNKKSTSFVQNSDTSQCVGHKWGIKALFTRLRSEGVDTDRIWEDIIDIVVKTFLSVEAQINSGIKYNCIDKSICHELFGFDIMLESNLRPWLIEVNISPSMASSSRLDRDIKGDLLRDVFNIAGFKPPALQQAYSFEILGGSGPASSVSSPTVGKSEDRRVYGRSIGSQGSLTVEERQKHAYFVQNYDELCATQRLRSILEKLTDDDVCMLMETEEEARRCGNLVRVFPTVNSDKYFSYFETPRYYNVLVHQWLTATQSPAVPDLGCMYLQCLAEQALASHRKRGQQLSATMTSTAAGMATQQLSRPPSAMAKSKSLPSGATLTAPSQLYKQAETIFEFVKRHKAAEGRERQEPEASKPQRQLSSPRSEFSEMHSTYSDASQGDAEDDEEPLADSGGAQEISVELLKAKQDLKHQATVRNRAKRPSLLYHPSARVVVSIEGGMRRRFNLRPLTRSKHASPLRRVSMGTSGESAAALHGQSHNTLSSSRGAQTEAGSGRTSLRPASCDGRNAYQRVTRRQLAKRLAATGVTVNGYEGTDNDEWTAVTASSDDNDGDDEVEITVCVNGQASGGSEHSDEDDAGWLSDSEVAGSPSARGSITYRSFRGDVYSLGSPRDRLTGYRCLPGVVSGDGGVLALKVSPHAPPSGDEPGTTSAGVSSAPTSARDGTSPPRRKRRSRSSQMLKRTNGSKPGSLLQGVSSGSEADSEHEVESFEPAGAANVSHRLAHRASAQVSRGYSSLINASSAADMAEQKQVRWPSAAPRRRRSSSGVDSRMSSAPRTAAVSVGRPPLSRVIAPADRAVVQSPPKPLSGSRLPSRASHRRSAGLHSRHGSRASMGAGRPSLPELQLDDATAASLSRILSETRTSSSVYSSSTGSSRRPPSRAGLYGSDTRHQGAPSQASGLAGLGGLSVVGRSTSGDRDALRKPPRLPRGGSVRF